MVDFQRTVQTTVKTELKEYERLSVKISVSIPRERMFEVMKIAKDMVIKEPPKIGDTVVRNILDMQVDLVTTASINKNAK